MYILEYEDEYGNLERLEYDWTEIELDAAIRELKNEGFCNFRVEYVEE